ncbi:lactate utilization protein C [Gracilibacillus sp. YIM 98692]|uniref:LutC/YkgG family protein n=1 Tax=Gracilibacillus sp. YIM 98692 TaxID=2663532 RepID=UPI0013D44C44|nr:lactate utilization protein C [Gracilibacillus sp. YIM 98692]
MTLGNIENRERFLSNIRDKIGGLSADKPVQKPNWSTQPQYRVLKDQNQDQLIKVLKDQCKHIHTDFYHTDEQHLDETLNEIFEEYGVRSIVYTCDSRFQDHKVDTSLKQSGLDTWEWDDNEKEASIQFSEKADVGITFSDITLAESGTVVLFNGQGKGRSVSLLPQNYIAIIPKSTIVKRMTQATEKIHKQVENGEDISSCINFITGPSNSADIEMNLIVGVHGPIRAAYVVVDDI